MPKNKTALICGVGGQDGAYLAQLLLRKGYSVSGTSRDAQVQMFSNLKHLGIYDQIEMYSMNLNDFRSVIETIKRSSPNEIYNLAGQSSVGLSFNQPVETMESISIGTLNLLEAIRFLEKPCHFYNAGSSECFGETPPEGANEETPFRPRSPYAVAKAAAFWQVANYREAYRLYSCSGILFNHESPLRPNRFVTRKIIDAVKDISDGKQDKLHLGNLNIHRDWGWAPDYVEAMWLMLQQDKPADFVVATGETHSLKEFTETAFGLRELDYRDFLVEDDAFYRPTDISYGRGDPSKAARLLGWSAKYKMRDVIQSMLDS